MGHLDAAAGLDAGDGRARSNVDAARRLDQPARIGRTGHGEGEELAEAKPGVAAMAGMPPASPSRSEHDDIADAADGEAARGRQAGGSAADDDDVVDGHAALRIGRSGSRPAAEFGHARAAIEALAAAHHAARAPLEAAEVAGRQRARERRLDLGARHELAMTDDLRRSRVVGRRAADVRRDWAPASEIGERLSTSLPKLWA